MESKRTKLKYFDEFSSKLENLLICWIGGELNCSLDGLYERVNELFTIYIEKEVEERRDDL